MAELRTVGGGASGTAGCFRAGRLAVLLALGAALGGCAYVTAVPVEPHSRVSGIRIYDVKPILIVSGTSAKVEMIPNYNRAYALQFGAFLAKNDFKATMANGLLTEVHANMDSTDFLKFLSELLKTVDGAQGLSQPGPGQSAGGVQNRFQVYDIVFDDHGNLTQLRPLVAQADLLHVPSAGVSVAAAPPVTTPQPPAGGGSITPGPITSP